MEITALPVPMMRMRSWRSWKRRSIYVSLQD